MSTNALAATSETTHSQEEIYAIMTAFAEAIDTMLADQTLWVVPKKSDGTLDTVAYPAFIETLFGRIASEAERTSIKTVWWSEDFTFIRQAHGRYVHECVAMPVPDVENGLQLLREKLEYMRFEMTVLERGNGLVADLAMTVAGFVGTAVDAARGWLRRES